MFMYVYMIFLYIMLATILYIQCLEDDDPEHQEEVVYGVKEYEEYEEYEEALSGSGEQCCKLCPNAATYLRHYVPIESSDLFGGAVPLNSRGYVHTYIYDTHAHRYIYIYTYIYI